jgi:molybdopterin synthase sulfur carrier subunit
METSLPTQPADETGLTLPVVTVRYWAAARAAAGVIEERFAGQTVFEVLAQARIAHDDNPRFARVLSISSLLLGDQPVATRDLPGVAVTDGDVLEVLPPFAGG